MDDMSSLMSGEDIDISDHLIDIADTSFIETRSGYRYGKIFVIKK